MHVASRYRTSIEGVLISVIFWTVFIGIGLIHEGTHWPQATPAFSLPNLPQLNRPAISAAENYENLFWLMLESELFWLMTYSAVRRTLTWEPLGAAFFAVSVAFCFVLTYSIAAQLYAWEATVWIRRLCLRGPLIAASAFAIYQLLRIQDDPRENPDDGD